MEYTLHLGDCLDVMATMPDASIDTIITDPPYGLAFMGKEWDHGVPGMPFWSEALRVAKPGAMLLAFGGTRTFHRLTCAIEDAGWEIRDCVMWLYGSGFPKSHDIGKAIDKAVGAEREIVGHNSSCRLGHNRNLNDDGWSKIGQQGAPITAPATPEAEQWDGWGTALKPAYEPVIVAMKPIDGTFAHNALTHGVAGLWIDGARVGHTVETWPSSRNYGPNQKQPGGKGETIKTGPAPSGRWPANVIHDGSDEVTAGFPVTSGVSKGVRGRGGTKYANGKGFANTLAEVGQPIGFGDTGSAARFFY